MAIKTQPQSGEPQDQGSQGDPAAAFIEKAASAPDATPEVPAQGEEGSASPETPSQTASGKILVDWDGQGTEREVDVAELVELARKKSDLDRREQDLEKGWQRHVQAKQLVDLLASLPAHEQERVLQTITGRVPNQPPPRKDSSDELDDYYARVEQGDRQQEVSPVLQQRLDQLEAMNRQMYQHFQQVEHEKQQATIAERISSEMDSYPQLRGNDKQTQTARKLVANAVRSEFLRDQGKDISSLVAQQAGDVLGLLKPVRGKRSESVPQGLVEPSRTPSADDLMDGAILQHLQGLKRLGAQ